MAATTRRRVLDAAAALGYVPNASARALAAKRVDQNADTDQPPTGEYGIRERSSGPYGASTAALATSVPARSHPTLVLLLPNFGFNLESLWLSAVEVARDKAVNLITYQIGTQPSRAPAELGSLLGSAAVDAILVAPDNLLIPTQDTKAYLDHLGPIPAVSLGAVVPGVPSVLPDNDEGIKLAVDHLIEVHGLDRIAYARGPESIGWEQARYRGYRDSLMAHGLQPDPKLVVPPAAADAWTDGERILGVLMKERHLRPGTDFSAIVLSNDIAAKSVSESLQRCGLRVPGDVRVTGYDDTLEARSCSPPVTTIRQPEQEIARLAIEIALARLAGHEVPEITTLSPVLVIRRSCGCQSRVVTQAGEITPAPAAPSADQPARTGQPRRGTLDSAPCGPIPGDDCERLLRAHDLACGIGPEAESSQLRSPDVGSDVSPKHAEGTFIELWEDVLRRQSAPVEAGPEACAAASASGLESDAWHRALTALRRRRPVCDASVGYKGRAEGLWHQARVAIDELGRQSQDARLVRSESEARALRDLNAALVSTLDLRECMQILVDGLDGLGIPGAYLFIREGQPLKARWHKLCLMSVSGQQVKVPPALARCPTSLLLPPELWPDHEPFSLVVSPLQFGEVELGLAILEVGPTYGRIYDELKAVLSGALRAHYLYEEALRAQEAAEQANRLKTRLMANVSHELRAPLHVILRQAQTVLDDLEQGPSRGCGVIDADSALPIEGARNAPGPGPANQGPTSPGPRRKAQKPPLSPFLANGQSTNLQDHPWLLRQIQANAKHQLRMVNDLLDLSRAEINELTLSLTLVDPRPFLEEVFLDVVASSGQATSVAWQLQVPVHLPAISADPHRLRQILYNLLSNAARFTDKGRIVLGAEASPRFLHIWVEDTGTGIPEGQQERIFEPFLTVEQRDRRLEGVGLGLSITRRLVALHGGTLTLDSREVGTGPDHGSTFHVHLPLPARNRTAHQALWHDHDALDPVLLLVADATRPEKGIAPEIVSLAKARGIRVHPVGPTEDIDQVLNSVRPVVVGWDSSAAVGDINRLQQLCSHPELAQVPCVFVSTGGAAHVPREDQTEARASAVESLPGPVHTVPKPVGEAVLLGAITAFSGTAAAGAPLCGTGAPATGQVEDVILVVDDDPEARQRVLDVIADHMPTSLIEVAEDGASAVAAMMRRPPTIVVLDLGMPEMDGFDVLEWMRAYPRTQRVPVVILTGRVLTLNDIRRLEQYAHVTLHSKGILSDDETAEALHRSLFGADAPPAHTSALVKRAIAHIHQNHNCSLTRAAIADAVGVSSDYLTTIFKRELGLTPSGYLSRYRVARARHLLDQGTDSITEISHAVGFEDPAYFSRVFKRIVGIAPSAYRKRA